MCNKRRPCTALLLTLFLSLLLGACSMVRTTYDHAQTISYWWLDSYFDFADNQEVQVKNDLREFHQWHRTTQLPEYADILTAIGGRTLGDSSPASTCDDIDKVRAELDAFASHAVPSLARLARQLSPVQISHLRKKIVEIDETWREKWIKPTPEELAEARFDDWTNRAGSFYGDISDEQKVFMKKAIAHSVLDLQISWEQRQRRQQDILSTFGKIVESGSNQSAAEKGISALLDRSLHPKDPAYEAMFQKLLAESCANLAGLHQLTTPKQRIRAQEKLAGYERDFRVLSKN
jgi:hypothetical protein